MDHKGSVIHFDLLSKINKLFYVKIQLIPNNVIPTKINSIT